MGKDSSKRKHADAASSSPKKSKSKHQDGAGVTVQVDKQFAKGDSATRGTSGIVLATFADYKPAANAQFNLYRSEGLGRASGSSSRSSNECLILAGETETIEYLGSNFQYGSQPSERGYTGEYMIGVYDPSTSSVTLRPAPLFTVSRSIKALKDLAPISAEGEEVTDLTSRMAARRALGDQFGNAKQRTTARNQDRMKVDTKHMESYMDDVRAGIEAATASLPSREAINSLTESARPAPPLNTNAQHPADAYPLAELVPPAVLRAIPIGKLLSCESQDGLKSLLPWGGPGRSRWFLRRIWAAIQGVQYASGTHIDFDTPTANKEEAKNRVRVGFYAALLWALLKISPAKLGDRQEALSSLRLDHGEGSAVLDDLLARFTETQKGQTKVHLTPFTRSKALNYFAALILHLDNFAVSYTDLAKDMEMSSADVRGAFRILGCKTVKRVTSDIDLAPGQEKHSENKVVLTCPVELPKPSRGPPKKK